MQTVLIPISSNFFARNFLRTDAFKFLREYPGVRVVLLANKRKVEYYQQEYQFPNVVFDVLPEVRQLLSERFFKFVEQSSIATHRTYIDHRTYLFRQRPGSPPIQLLRRLPLFVFMELFRYIGKIGTTWRNVIRSLYSFYPDRHFSLLLEKYTPDIVFCPTMIWAEEYCLLREAKKFRISTIGQVFSWDTFYSKTFLRLHPDKLIVQTDDIKLQAGTFGDFPKKDVVVAGVIQYDRHFTRRGITSREDFFSRIGGDPKKRLILYAFSGKAGLAIDFDIVDILHHAILANEIHEFVEVLLRPYPSYDFSEEKIQKLRAKYGFLGQPSTRTVGTDHADWEMDEKSIEFLENSLAHADLVITIYSTFLVEAAIFNKPIIAPAFDGYQWFGYWNSARRFFDWDHLKNMKAIGGVSISRNRDEFVSAINTSLQDANHLECGRKAIVKKQCQFTDGNSGQRVAGAILSLMGKS